MSELDPTADYRKYPKSPSFLTVVILASVALLVVLAIGLFLVSESSRKTTVRKPDPTPNSMVEPLIGNVHGLQRA